MNKPGIDTSHVVYIWDIQTIIDVMNFTENLAKNPGTYYVLSNNCTTVAVTAAKMAGMDLPNGINTPWDLSEEIVFHAQNCPWCSKH